MRLIDANALIQDEGIDTYSAIFAVANAPTIDAVQIVRCKDCKYYKPWEGTILSYCAYHDNAQYVRRADDYCSRGERR